jgi:hypothetical protein
MWELHCKRFHGMLMNARRQEDAAMFVTVPPASVATRTSADLLSMAADLLPAVVGNGPMLSSDLHSSLFSAVRLMPHGDDLGRAHLVADQAEELFAAFLISVREVRAGRSVSHTIRGWAAGATAEVVAGELRAAAQFYASVLPAAA